MTWICYYLLIFFCWIYIIWTIYFKNFLMCFFLTKKIVHWDQREKKNKIVTWISHTKKIFEIQIINLPNSCENNTMPVPLYIDYVTKTTIRYVLYCIYNNFIGIKYLRHGNVMQCVLHLYIFVHLLSLHNIVLHHIVNWNAIIIIYLSHLLIPRLKKNPLLPNR